MALDDNKGKAQRQAIAQAAARLRGIDLRARSEILGLSPSPSGAGLAFRVFGRDIKVTPDLDVLLADTGQPVPPADHILVLHYLLCEEKVEPTGKLISFRDLPGGQFYWEPYRSRTVVPLATHFGNDLDRLRKQFDRFDWTSVLLGDLAARFHALGKVHLTLVYYKGDADFEPSAEIFFDSCLQRIYCTEDAVVLAARICRGLIAQDCEVCSGCGICAARRGSDK